MPTASTILKTLLEKYAHCGNYLDRGVVKLSTESEPSIMFSTIFIRGVGFQFEWTQDNGKRYSCIWFDGRETREYAQTYTCKRVRSLSLAIHRASFGTLGASCYIPSLLMPDLLPDSEALKVGPYKLSQEGESFVLRSNRDGHVKELWINKVDRFVERIVAKGISQEHAAYLKNISQPNFDLLQQADPLQFLNPQYGTTILYEKVRFDDEIATITMRKAMERLESQ